MSMFSEIKEIFPLDINCDDPAEVANLEVPVAKFYKDDFKLHRRGSGTHNTVTHNAHSNYPGMLVQLSYTYLQMWVLH